MAGVAVFKVMLLQVGKVAVLWTSQESSSLWQGHQSFWLLILWGGLWGLHVFKNLERLAQKWVDCPSKMWSQAWRTRIRAGSPVILVRLLSGFWVPDMAPLSPTISICVRGEHLVDYIPFLRSGHRIGPSPIIINKVLLAHSRAQHLHTVCGCFHIAAAELSHYSRDHITQKDKNIYYLALCRSSLLTPGLGCVKVKTLL